MENPNDGNLDELLHAALSSPIKADFDDWCEKHQYAVAHLNPIVTESYHRKRRIAMRIVSGTTVAAFVFAAVFLTLAPDRSSYAQVIKTISEAKDLTWSTTTFERFYSKDGSRTWLRVQKSKHVYRHPGLYRNTSYDENGNMRRVTIVDQQRGESLALDMKSRKTLRPPSVEIESRPRRPFEWVAEMLRSAPMEIIGEQSVGGRMVNVIRFPEGRGRDVWIDTESKQFVGWSDPSADQIDFLNLPDRNNRPEDEFLKGTMLGSITDDIVYDTELEDPDLFSLSPPPGFEVIDYPTRPTVTEAEMVEWLGITSRVNNNNFVDEMPAINIQLFNAAEAKDKSERTVAEQQFIDTYRRHHLNGNTSPTWDFQHDETVPGTFRYVGKGVTLGTAGRIVCWYKLKSSGKYRAVFGDLAVKDVQPSELPIPVEP